MKNFDVKYTAEALINFLFPLFETRKLKVRCYFLDKQRFGSFVKILVILFFKQIESTDCRVIEHC